jgi:hypothetical protein
MDGIVSLFDNDHNQLVEELWAELKQEFSVDGVYITPYPHFSYHVAQDYDVDKIESVLQRITANITTFKRIPFSRYSAWYNGKRTIHSKKEFY